MPCWRDFSKMSKDHKLYLVGLSVPHTRLASLWKDARNSIPTGSPAQKPQECSFSWYGNSATIWRHLENYSLGDKYFSPLHWFKIDRVSPQNYAFLSPRWRAPLGKLPLGAKNLCCWNPWKTNSRTQNSLDSLPRILETKHACWKGRHFRVYY